MKSRITRMTAALLAAVLSLGLLVGCKPKKELTRYTTICLIYKVHLFLMI